MINAALILEGGALRGLFTSGVTDVFLKNDMHFSCVAGVSAGSLIGINYVGKQIGRSAEINLEFVNDKRYLGINNAIFGQSIFNFDFLFGPISMDLYPFNWDEFMNSKQRFVSFATDCRKGVALVHEGGSKRQILDALRASSSMPLLSKMTGVKGRKCLDGGITIAIPYRWAIDEKYDKIVLVLTRDKGFRKPPLDNKIKALYKQVYRKYPKLVERLITMNKRYNMMLDEIEQLEEEGRIFVIRPEKPVRISRVEKDVVKLRALYNEGLKVGEKQLEDLKAYLER